MTIKQQTLGQDEVLVILKDIFVDFYEVEPDDISRNARLYEDLDIDSIDAVDLMVLLKKKTGQKLDPETFKSVRTVDDLIQAITATR